MLSLEKRVDLASILLKHEPHFAFLVETWLELTPENSDLSAGDRFQLLEDKTAYKIDMLGHKKPPAHYMRSSVAVLS